jgi:hypothetical protein
MCDQRSRATGKLVKMVSVSHLGGMGWASFSRKFMSIMGAAATETELLYPQLLGSTLIVQPPSWISMVLGFAKLVLPAKTFAKVRVCSGNFGEDIAKCPIASTIFSVAELPTFLGGECTNANKGGSIAGIPNTFTSIVMGTEKERALAGDLTVCKMTASIVPKPKDYPHRLRVVLNSTPVRTDGGAAFINVMVKQRELKSVALAPTDLGPYLMPHNSEGKPIVEKDKHFLVKLVWTIYIEKVDMDDNVTERKEKRVEVEVAPLVALQNKVLEFGDTADVTFSYTPTKFTPHPDAFTSPLLRKGVLDSASAAPAAAAAAPAAVAAAAAQ